jgi:dCTP diphosphatase
MSDSIEELTKAIINYRDKNLAANLAVEAGELLEHYRWQDEPDDPQATAEEAADLLYSILLFAHEVKIDLGAEMLKKLEKNATKYPANKAKGRAAKYTHYIDT